MPTHVPKFLSNALHTPHSTPQQTSFPSILPQPASATNYNTAGYRVYIGFLAFGIIMIVLFSVAAAGMLLTPYYRELRRQYRMREKDKGRVSDVEAVHVKMEGIARPAPVALPRERAH